MLAAMHYHHREKNTEMQETVTSGASSTGNEKWHRAPVIGLSWDTIHSDKLFTVTNHMQKEMKVLAKIYGLSIPLSYLVDTKKTNVGKKNESLTC